MKNPKTGEEWTPVLKKKSGTPVLVDGEQLYKVMVAEEETLSLSDNMGDVKRRVAFVTGKKRFFELFKENLHRFTIQRQLSFDPFWEEQKPVQAGERGNALIGGQPYYHKYVVVEKSLSLPTEVWVEKKSSVEETDEMF